MFSDQIASAITTARGGRALDDVSRAIWAGLAQGSIDDDTAQAFAEQLHARRMAENASRASPAAAGGFGGRPSIFPPRRHQRPRLRAVSIERRRRLASSGPLPPSIACKFTVSELACLRIVGDEWRTHGACRITLGEIAARAGCCRRLAQNTMRRAARMGLLAIEERRLKGRPNLPNVVIVCCREWSAWLLRGPGIAGKKGAPTDTKFYPRGKRRAEPVAHPDYRRGMQRPHGAGT
jgi:hypothetical protein